MSGGGSSSSSSGSGDVFGALISHEGTCVSFYFLLLEEVVAAAQMSASAAKWSRSRRSKRWGGDKEGGIEK